MAYDEMVANRLRAAFARALGPSDDIEEKKMFGGMAGMVNGHMCVGVIGNELVVRARTGDAAEALSRPHARPMDFTGKPMKGWLYVAPAGFAEDADLDGWVKTGLAFVHEAGPKKGAPMKATPTKAASMKAAPAKAAPRKAAPPKAAPTKAAPPKAAPKKAVSKKSADAPAKQGVRGQ